MVDEAVGGEFQQRGHAGLKLQEHLHIVVHLTGEDCLQMAGRGDHFPRNHVQQLIQQMDAPVQQHATAVLAIATPAVHGAPGALHPGLDEIGLTDGALLQRFPDDSVVPVPAPVLVHREYLSGLFGHGNHLFQFCRVHGHGLLADDILPGPHAGDGVILVEVVGDGDGHQVHFLIRQQFFRALVGIQALLLHALPHFGADIIGSLDGEVREVLPNHAVMPSGHAAIPDECNYMFHVNSSLSAFLSCPLHIIRIFYAFFF